MILLKDLLLELTFNDLLKKTDSGRIARASGMDVKSLKIDASSDGESWIFSYKSSKSTTGKRHKGYIKFFKGKTPANKSSADWECIVDCECPDFRYRIAYNDTKQGASVTGNNSYNKNNGATPKSLPQRDGLCKHLVALGKYLQTQIDTKRANKKTIKECLDELVIENNNKIILL
jgi:hypothetical protein